jgi:hypothetical protein
MPATQEQCHRFINWRALEFTPAELFELDLGYTKNDIKKAYKTFALIFSPDKNPGQEARVLPAFELLGGIRDYLIYTLETQEEDLEDNVFYRYYMQGMNPESNSIYDQLEARSKTVYDNLKTYKDTEWAQEITPHIDYLTQLVTQHPELITYTYSNRNYSFALSDKNIVYCAAHWNQPLLFAKLLELDADPTRQTEMGISPLDIAISRQCIDVLACLQTKFGAPWLQTHFDDIFSSGDDHNYEALFNMYEHFFPEQLSDTETLIQNKPLLIPALYRTNKIDEQHYDLLIKAKIIGMPALYLHLSAEEKQDPYMILALLAQDRSHKALDHIPFDKLNPAFCTALTDVWPEEDLKYHVSRALHRDEPPYPNTVNQSTILGILAFTLVISLLCALAIHFWPLIMLAPALSLLSILLLPVLELTGLMLSLMMGQKYLTETLPEARKINTILTENNFFTPLPADHEPSMPPEQEQSSVCGYLRGLVT